MSESRFKGSNLVAAGILLSRIAGILRTIVLGVVLGGNKVASDAFFFAMRVPNLLQNLLGEGSLSASFIPVYARLVEEGDEERASRLAGATLALLTCVTSLLVLAGVLLARPLVWLFTNWEGNPEIYELAISLTRVTTVGLGFMVISAWCLGVLNSHRSFFLSYASPVVWNIAQIAALAVGALLVWPEHDIALVLAWSVVAGSILQVLIQVPKVSGFAPSVRPNLLRTPELGDVMRRFVPAVSGRGIVQVSSFADTFLAGAITLGATGWYGFALPLYITPISLFGFSVAASELAEMSRQGHGAEAIIGRLRPALRRVIIPAGFITVAYLVASPLIVDALYGWLSRLANRGLSEPGPLLAVAYLLTAFSLGLPAAMTSRVSQNTLYSLGDVRGPARISAVRLAVSITVGAIAMLQLDWLTIADSTIATVGDVPHFPPWERVPAAQRLATDGPPHLGVVGLGLGASAGAWAEWLLLRRRVAAKLGRPVSSGLARTVLTAAAAAALAMLAIRWLAGIASIPAPIDALLVVGAGFAAYLAVLIQRGVELSEFR